MAQIDWLNTSDAMTRFNKELADAMRKTLLDQEHYASGKLYNSVKSETKSRQKKIQSVIKSLARGEDIDRTRYNVFLSVSQILTWMTRKNKTVYSSRKFNFKDIKQKRRIAYSIQKTLQQEGTQLSFNGKPKTGWITENYNRHKIDIDKRLAKYVLADVLENIDTVLRELTAKDPNIKII